jgi:pimeloyl-ACP methyl ester carboxylesterase
MESIYRTEQSRGILADFYRGVLTKWNFDYTSSTVPTRFGETNVLAAGDPGKPALVLLHGAASNALGWGGALAQYGKDFRVIAPDIPGEAGMSSPERPSWGNDDYILWLDDVLDTLEVKTAALMGLSFGGWIAAKYATHRKPRVSRLALLAPGGICPARASTILKTIVYSMQKERGAEKMKRLVFGKGEILPEISLFFDLLQQHYVPRFGSPPLLSDDELRAITCPVLLAEGGKDAFFNARRTAARLKALLPHAEIQIDSKGKHGITEYGGDFAAFLSDIQA